MSNMEDRLSEMESVKMSNRTKAALASIEASKRSSEAAGYAVIGGAMAYGDGALGDGIFAKVSGAAKWFVLWFAMIVPVYLFWVVAF